jgi:Stress responsive A/B Barrel Domain
MIKHIVMWTIKEGETSRMKFERMAEVKARLLELKAKVSVVASLEVFFNSPLAPQDNFDVVLVSEFNTWADLEQYKIHPDHVEVAAYINNVRQNRAAIDFEF